MKKKISELSVNSLVDVKRALSDGYDITQISFRYGHLHTGCGNVVYGKDSQGNPYRDIYLLDESDSSLSERYYFVIRLEYVRHDVE